MNLADMLTYADITQLSRIANHYQCECNGNSKHELIQSILQAIGRRGFIEHYLDGMSTEDMRFLNTLLFDGRKQFSLEDLMACAKQSRKIKDEQERENPREIISRFRQRAWLFQGATPRTRYLFEVPDDLRRRLREILEQRIKSGILRAESEPVIYREEPELMSADLLLFLEYVNGHHVALNAEGVMYRRSQMQIMELLHVSEPLVGKGWRFGYGRRFKDYPSRFSLLYDYAFHIRLVKEEGDSLTLTSSGLSYLKEERREAMQQFVAFWLRLYRIPIPNLLSIIYWINCSAADWISERSLYQQLEPLISPFFYDTPESIFEERVLRMLLHLGMIRIGEDETGERYVQATGFGKTAVRQLYKE
ncbi:hypothetical protein [Paenibacillus aceti]|uniref:Helicase XPB/Ssl2 N-terminal domain-containing protein n=1 Tax=Paenibacillus aceti TaxID=1820010 RepID=A0ABQ1W0J8_9BACL|nr:hypothetical protein [Paenibacillus aceti]GGG05215.1 hypothetical protein GCM10010913_28800 [Paenibacillus aceti]